VNLTPRFRSRTVLAAGAVATAILLPAVALASSAGSQSASAPAAARCKEGDLTDWVGVPGGATAGSVYYDLEISDTSSVACSMYGFPGVSALGPGGVHYGSPAARNVYGTEQTITLEPGDTAHVVLQITDTGNFPKSDCRPKTADALLVYAPGAYSAKTVPFSFQACSKTGPVFLEVSTSFADTGIPGYSDGGQ
jgi:hypothetical protein